MSQITELYGVATDDAEVDWQTIVANEQCPYLGRKCLKIRKSRPELSIGSCSVAYGKKQTAIICPYRLLERRQIFTDCVHLLASHQPNNELHLVPEVTIPGGSVDYVLVSSHQGQIQDFVGIELQALDTTGTLWPERQRFLREKNLPIEAGDVSADSPKPYGLNWKMTAKTILVQMHHKVETFEEIDKHLVLVIQDGFMSYMQKEFQLGHLNAAQMSDSAHFHTYQLSASAEPPNGLRLQLSARYSTDAKGIAQSLGLQALGKMELDEVTKLLAAKMSERTRFKLG